MNNETTQKLSVVICPDDALLAAVRSRVLSAAASDTPHRTPHRAFAVAAAVVVLVAAALAVRSIWLYPMQQPSTPSVPTETQTITGNDPSDAQKPPMPHLDAVPRNPDGSITYTDLTVDGKQSLSVLTVTELLDIATFSEMMVNSGVLCFEGVVEETHWKHYDFRTYYGEKFGEETYIHYTPVSQVTTFRIGKAWRGDPSLVGTTVILEDEGGSEDGTFGYRQGVPYVVIVEKLRRTDVSEGHNEQLVEGDRTRETPLCTLYPWHPQVEITKTGDYIVPTDWKTMASGDVIPVRLDESVPFSGWGRSDYEWYKDRLCLVKAEDFRRVMQALVDTPAQKN